MLILLQAGLMIEEQRPAHAATEQNFRCLPSLIFRIRQNPDQAGANERAA
jgi:hypothetical protein